jgi:hypothetical protein
VELVNLAIAIVLVAASWWATVRLLAWSSRRTERPLRRKPLPRNRTSSVRHFADVLHLPGTR